MKKEMEWAKSSMEKHYKSRGHLPLRSKVPLAELYPRPDVDYDKEELIDQDSSSADVADLNSITLSLKPDKASNNLRWTTQNSGKSRPRTEQFKIEI